MEVCREVVLCGVSCVTQLGSPGRIIVFGPNAEPVLTGSDKEDVVLAAAQLGKGRIFVFAHNAYGVQFNQQARLCENSTLYRNVRKWVTGKEPPDNLIILNLDESEPMYKLEELQTCDVLLSLSGIESTSSDLVEEYIRGGGAFVHAATPWGWLQINSGKTILDIPYIKILLTAGISYSQDISEDRVCGYNIKSNKALDAHLGHCFICNDFVSLIDKVRLLRGIKDLPLEHSASFKPVIDKLWEAASAEVAKFISSGKIKTNNLAEKNILECCNLLIELKDKKVFKACGIKKFPGDFDALPPLSCKYANFSSAVEDHYFTSCYVPAGVEVSLNVTRVTNVWIVIVGAHTDYLMDVKVNRWPQVSVQTEIKSCGTYDISNPFGGSVYFLSPKQAESIIEFTISNVVVCPRFDLLDRSISWKQSRNNPGLWADISGRYMTVTVPSSSIRNLEDPTGVIELYDELLKVYHDLRGTDINEKRRMWIVADEQPCAGYMHAGYPIVTHLDVADPSNDCYLLSDASFKSGKFWGIFHEMGHNMQQSEWTFEGTGEVTVNIFTLYGMQTICGIDSWIHPWLKEHISSAIKYLESGADFNKWKEDPGLALFFYAQLAKSFEWKTYKRIFRRYQNLPHNERPVENQDKIDLWFLMFSEECKFNIAPMALFWGIPLSNGCSEKLAALNFKEFLPGDEITEMVPSRVKLVANIFPNITNNS